MEIAEQLLELWDDYLASRPVSGHVFQPTMTDFMAWVRKQQKEQNRKPARTEAVLIDDAKGDDYLPRPRRLLDVKIDPEVEAGGAQCRRSDAETQKEIKRMYRAGYATARIRQELELPWSQWTLDRIRKIGNPLTPR